jgi:hypothetical protein
MYTSFIFVCIYIYIYICLIGESFSDARHETQTNPVKKLRIDNALTFTGEGGSNYHNYTLHISYLISIYLSVLSIHLSIYHIYLSIVSFNLSIYPSIVLFNLSICLSIYLSTISVYFYYYYTYMQVANKLSMQRRRLIRCDIIMIIQSKLLSLTFIIIIHHYHYHLYSLYHHHHHHHHHRHHDYHRHRFHRWISCLLTYGQVTLREVTKRLPS